MKSRINKKVGRWLGILLFLLSAFFSSLMLSYMYSPMSNGDESYTTITINKGSGFTQILKTLEEHQIVRHPLLFHFLTILRGDISHLQAGEFEINHSWTPNQLLNYLVSGRSRMYRVTIPEGWNYAEAVEKLHKTGLGNKERYLELFTAPHMLEKIGWPDARSLEGFLVPETYFFSKHQTEEEILSKMIQQFKHSYTSSYRQRASELAMTDYEVLILASLIEKETGLEEDRSLISAVFHNRLKRKMRLETDPSVIYGVENFDGNLTRQHLNTPSSYNTYKNFGLPPTPITNPGKSSLDSALFPADVNYLYFVARGDGSSVFSEDLKSHNQAVMRYQKNRGASTK